MTARLYLLIDTTSADDDFFVPDVETRDVYPRFTFARSRRRALNWFRQVLGPRVPPEAVFHVPPSRMTDRDAAMLAIFGPSKIRGQTFEMRVRQACANLARAEVA